MIAIRKLWFNPPSSAPPSCCQLISILRVYLTSKKFSMRFLNRQMANFSFLSMALSFVFKT